MAELFVRRGELLLGLFAPEAAQAVVDPTGCGDAFRGGLLFGLSQGWDLVKSVALANRIGAIKIAVAGPQNYTLDRAALGV